MGTHSLWNRKSRTLSINVSFFSETAICFSHCQNRYSKSLSWHRTFWKKSTFSKCLNWNSNLYSTNCIALKWSTKYKTRVSVAFKNLRWLSYFLRSLCLPPLIVTGNLFVTSKTKPRIHQFTNLKCCIKAKEPFKTPFNGVLVLI